MQREEFFEFQKQTFNKIMAMTKKKNADYAGNGGDAFNNFTRIEAIGVATTEQGFLTRMFDKFSRIISFMQNGELQVKDESVEDTLFDLANYCILMAGYLKSKRGIKVDMSEQFEKVVDSIATEDELSASVLVDRMMNHNIRKLLFKKLAYEYMNSFPSEFVDSINQVIENHPNVEIEDTSLLCVCLKG